MIVAAITLAAIQPALVPVCRGSGAYIAPDRILTALHVVDRPDCILTYGRVIFSDPKNDVAVIETTQTRASFLRVSCRPARAALAANHAGFASSMRWNGGDRFTGRVYPGMSGAPIVDASGAVFSIVSAGPKSDNLLAHFASFATGGMLHRTGLCGKVD